MATESSSRSGITAADLRRLLARPITFHPCLVEPSGSVYGALMVSQLLYWSDKGSDPNGWIYKTQEEWQKETKLKRHEQETARKSLRQTSFWQEERRGLPAKLYYRLDLDELAKAIEETEEREEPENPPTAESPQPASPAPDRVDSTLAIYATTLRELSKKGYERAQKLNLPAVQVDYAELIRRDKMVCGICAKPIIRGPGRRATCLQFDHIVPLCEGGEHSRANIRCTHAGCNLARRVGKNRSQSSMPACGILESHRQPDSTTCTESTAESTPENRTRDSAPSTAPTPADAGQSELPLEERKPLSRPFPKSAFTAKLGSPKPLGTAIKVKKRSLSMRARLQRIQDPVGPKPNGASQPVWQSHGSPATPAAPSQPPYPPGPRPKPGKRRTIQVAEQALPIIAIWSDYYRADCKRNGRGFTDQDPDYHRLRWMWTMTVSKLIHRGEAPGVVLDAMDLALDSLCYPVDRPWSFAYKYDLIKIRRAAVWGWLDRKAYMESPEREQENEENAKYYEWYFSGEHDPNASSQPMFPWEVEALNHRGPVGSRGEQTESEST